MVLQESQLRKIIADFCNKHFEGKSRNVIADEGAVSPTTVTNFLNGKANTGIYTVYRILKSMDQNFVTLGYEIAGEEARLESHPEVVRDSSTSSARYRVGTGNTSSRSYTTTPARSSTLTDFPYKTSQEQEKARQKALEILAKSGGGEKGRAVLDARQDDIEWDILVNQFLKEFLDHPENA